MESNTWVKLIGEIMDHGYDKTELSGMKGMKKWVLWIKV